MAFFTTPTYGDVVMRHNIDIETYFSSHLFFFSFGMRLFIQMKLDNRLFDSFASHHLKGFVAMHNKHLL